MKSNPGTMTKTRRFVQHIIIAFLISEFFILDSFGEFGSALSLHDRNTNREHRIVKRKSKGGRGFGFGRKTSGGKKPKPGRDPYPKQPGHNPAYPAQPAYNPSYPGGASAPHGPPPAYPGMSNNRPAYPGAPPPYSAGAGAHHNMPAYPPSYGQAVGGGGFGGAYPQGKYNQGGFGGRGYGKSGGGLGKTLGSAGFGAVAGTALGAYGGYKLGRMVGSLGSHGHYGYYNDQGRYMRCDPPRNIKFDPETNMTYIPLEDDYDKRCHYYDRRPPSYFSGYTNGATSSISHPINQLMARIVDFTIFSSIGDNYNLLINNAFAFAVVACLLL